MQLLKLLLYRLLGLKSLGLQYGGSVLFTALKDAECVQQVTLGFNICTFNVIWSYQKAVRMSECVHVLPV